MGARLDQIMRIILNASSTAVNIDIRRITFIDGKATGSGGGLMVSALNSYVNLEANRVIRKPRITDNSVSSFAQCR